MDGGGVGLKSSYDLVTLLVDLGSAARSALVFPLDIDPAILHGSNPFLGATLSFYLPLGTPLIDLRLLATENRHLHESIDLIVLLR